VTTVRVARAEREDLAARPRIPRSRVRCEAWSLSFTRVRISTTRSARPSSSTSTPGRAWLKTWPTTRAKTRAFGSCSTWRRPRGRAGSGRSVAGRGFPGAARAACACLTAAGSGLVCGKRSRRRPGGVGGGAGVGVGGGGPLACEGAGGGVAGVPRSARARGIVHERRRWPELASRRRGPQAVLSSIGATGSSSGPK
jgi:hypothetical protein